MPNGRSNLAFFTLVAASVSAAVVLVALLIAGDVAGPKVAMNNVPPSRTVTDNDSRSCAETDSARRAGETYYRRHGGRRFTLCLTVVTGHAPLIFEVTSK